MSEPLHPASVTATSLVLMSISHSPPRLVAGRVELDQHRGVAFLVFTPDHELEAGEVYQFVLRWILDFGGEEGPMFVQNFTVGG